LAPLGLGLQLAQFRKTFFFTRGIAFGFRQFDQRQSIFELGFERGKRAKPILKFGPFAHDFLRSVRVIPEIWIFDFGIQLGKSAGGNIDVKDASSAIQGIA
jgi:hypothetical protein